MKMFMYNMEFLAHFSQVLEDEGAYFYDISHFSHKIPV